MNDHDLDRELAALRRDVAPEVDLWPAIAARIDQAPRARLARRATRLMAYALAASLVAAAGLGLLAARHERAELAHDATSAARAEAARFANGELRSMDGAVAGALDDIRAQPSAGTRVSPGLYTAAAELAAAETKLKASLAVEPRATYLIEMLGRTQAKRLELEKRIRTT